MAKYKKQLVVGLTVSFLVLLGVCPVVFSHCEIPCGIYNDPMRLEMIAEHITTIEKSMVQINLLELNGESSDNQLVRWSGNKEKHADALNEIVTQYFMTQRIKPADPSNKKDHAKYVQQLTSLHQMLVYSMKCKQTTDLQNVEKLKSLLQQFSDVYGQK